MKTPALTKLAVRALEDLKAQDLLVLDVKALTPMTDVMVICTGTSTRHVKALAQSLVEEAKDNGVQPLGVEGLDQGEWALVDLNGVLVHVMQAQIRAFYQLEKLWQIEPPLPVEPAKAKVKTKAPKAKAATSGKRARPASGAKARTTKTPAKKATGGAMPPRAATATAKRPAKAAPKTAAKAADKASPKSRSASPSTRSTASKSTSKPARPSPVKTASTAARKSATPRKTAARKTAAE